MTERDQWEGHNAMAVPRQSSDLAPLFPTQQAPSLAAQAVMLGLAVPRLTGRWCVQECCPWAREQGMHPDQGALSSFRVAEALVGRAIQEDQQAALRAQEHGEWTTPKHCGKSSWQGRARRRAYGPE